MAETYGSYTPQNFEEYMTTTIGDYATELEQIYFTDQARTSYLAAVKWNADLIWNVYCVKQEHLSSELALINTDVLNTALLSLHPTEVVNKMDNVSTRTKAALEELSAFRSLILLEEGNESKMTDWLRAVPRFNYSFMLGLMGWFLTLASKMTGHIIPGVKEMTVGGRIKKDRKEVETHLGHMVTIAEAIAKEKHWNYLSQYSILKNMLTDLRAISDGYLHSTAGTSQRVLFSKGSTEDNSKEKEDSSKDPANDNNKDHSSEDPSRDDRNNDQNVKDQN